MLSVHKDLQEVYEKFVFSINLKLLKTMEYAIIFKT